MRNWKHITYQVNRGDNNEKVVKIKKKKKGKENIQISFNKKLKEKKINLNQWPVK